MRILLVAVAALCAVQVAARTPLMINEDPWYFVGHAPKEQFTVDGLRAHIDRFAQGGKVTHLCFCVNGMRTAYPSAVTEPMWRTVLPDGTVLEDKYNAFRDEFYNKGIDPFKVWIERAREKGISPWISMRINDVHHITTGNPRSSNAFWRAHPELRRVPNVEPTKTNLWWTAFAFNYSLQAVRDYEFAIFKEIVDRYDADGYELDTLRFWEHLTPGKAHEDAHFLTEFIQRCHEYTKAKAVERGHAIRLSARVLTSYEATRAFGFDPEEWARTDAIDLLIVCNFFNTVDFDFEFDKWLARIAAANPKVKVLPGATDCFDCEPCRCDYAAYCGFAVRMYAEGAQGLYLYNTSYLPDADKDAIFRDGLANDVISARPQRFVRTMHDCVPKGVARACYLPVPLDKPREIPLKAVASGEVDVIIGLDAQSDAPQVMLNGVAAQGAPQAVTNNARYGQIRKVPCVYRYHFNNAAATNAITVGTLTTKVNLRWVEIQVNEKK